MRFVEDHWAQLVPTLPARLRPVASTLPHRLGLCDTPDGAWTAFTRLPPMYDPVAFVPTACVGAAQQDRFRVAHCRAGYYGLLLDRVADHQARLSPGLLALRPHLRSAWTDALGQALDDRGRAWRVVRESTRRYRRGLAAEGRWRVAGALSPSGYFRIVRAKTAWLGVSTRCLVEACLGRAAAGRFAAAYGLLVAGLQCFDDGADCAEDARLRGVSWPAALSLPPAAMMAAGPSLLRRAAVVASRDGFDALAEWSHAYADTLAAAVAPCDVRGAVGAMMLVAEAEGGGNAEDVRA